jgi:DNA helicase-2/ATP-dependent DNA helicase PcrA
MYVPLNHHGLADGKGTSVADLLRLIIEKTGYEEHLRKTQSDFDSRWENVQELVRVPT